jgi:hypothetical protein
VTTLAEYLDRTADLSLNIGTTPMPGISVYIDEDKTSVKLRAWYATAIDWCNTKLSELDFVDSAGVDENPPDAVVLGVYEFVRVLRDYDARSNVLTKKTKTGAREEEFFEAGVAGRITAAGIAAWPYLEPSLKTWKSGSGS